MKRKETVSRLLLTLLTAFVMVAGVFGAAILPGNEDVSVTPSQKMLDDNAASELEKGTSVTGEAPVSAIDSDIAFIDTIDDVEEQTPMSTILSLDSTGQGAVEESQDPVPSLMTPDKFNQMNPDNAEKEQIENEIKERDMGEGEDPILEPSDDGGTRAPGDTIDANGPYGTPSNPKYEGMTLPLEAHAYDAAGNDVSSAYQFRWSPRNDGVFGAWSPLGQTITPHKYTDDYVGQALVQGWDGTYTTNTFSGDLLGQPTPYWYISYTYSWTLGYKFDVKKDITVDQLGAGRYSYPSGHYRLLLYTEGGSLLGQTGTYPSVPNNQWRFFPITPVPLSAGNTYIVCKQFYGYYDRGVDESTLDMETPDGAIEMQSGMVYTSGYGFPTTDWSITIKNFVDIKYSGTEVVENVIEDTADVFVWNNAPNVFGASVTPSEHVEGAGGEAFTAWLTDAGTDDDWWFKWEWDDGTETDWIPVPRYGGGAKVLFAHALAGWATDSITAVEAALGNNAVVFDVHNLASSNPTLATMMQYDVILTSNWGFPSDPAAWGDLLADYSDAGGGVVQTGGSMWSLPTDPGLGIRGRWLEDPLAPYNSMAYGEAVVSSKSLGTFIATDPIMDGITSMTSLVNHNSNTLTTYGRLVASYTNGDVCVAAADEGHHLIPGSGRIVSYNTYVQPAPYTGGQHFALLANAVMWASQQPDAYKLFPPIQLPAIDHVYKDDHPTTLTPQDTFHPRVLVKDDDHCNDVLIGQVLDYQQNFNSFGPYGDSPPTDWTIIDDGVKPPDPWNYNDWHRYYFSSYYPGGTGTYAARVYYYPVENQDEELISESIDVSGLSTVTLEYDHYYNDYSTATTDYGYVQVSFDGGSWTTVVTYSQFDDSGQKSHSVSVPGGSSSMRVRFRYVAYDEYYWFVDNVEVLDGSTSLFLEDFNAFWGTYGNNPPSGWSIIDNGDATDPWNTNDWHSYQYYSGYPSGTNTQAARAYYYPYETSDEWLISPVFDLTDPSFTEAEFSFTTYHYNYYQNNDADVLIRLDGGSWSVVDSFPDQRTNGIMVYDIDYALGHMAEVAFRWQSPYGFTGYGYWFVDDFQLLGIPEVRHVWGISDPVEVEKVIHNVMPTIILPDDFVDAADEANPFEFVGLEITDPALYEKTERFWYRWDMDDGTPVGPWIDIPPATGTLYEDFEQGTGWPWAPWTRYAGNPPMFESVHTGAAHDGTYGLEIDQGGYMWYYRTDLSLGMPGTRLAFWINLPGYGPSMTQSGRAYMGFGADAIGAYEFVIAPNTNQLMIYDDYPYGSFSQLAAQSYTFTRDGWYRAVMEFVSLTEVDCVLYDDDGTTELARIGATRGGGFNLPGGLSFRAFDYGQTPRHFYIDTYDDGAPPIDPVIPPFTHTFMDNGRYDVDFQALDDDMWWDFSTGYPIYRGPVGEEDAWISHNIIPIHVSNRDPVVGPIRAEINLDLAIRQTGEPGNPVTMTLFYDGGFVDDVIVTHQGNQQIGVIPATLDVGNINKYHLEVEYDGSGGGTNPTWIFQGRFSSGHIKELKHEYKDGDPTWVIGPEFLRQMLVGEDLTFLVDGYDVGSDDLGFLWVFGDDTPLAINVYANVAQTVAVEGTSAPAPEIFDVLGNRDPWFDIAPNDERSPYGGPISVSEAETHAFDEPYYYYVTLIVMDDDVCDGYVSFQSFVNGGGYDMEFIEIDLS